MEFETYPVDVAVRSSTRLPILVPGETAQNIVEIPTALQQVICSGDGTCGIQSSATGGYVHRPRNPLSQIRGTDSESIAELVRKTLMRCCDRCVNSVFLLPLLVRLCSDVRRPAHDLWRRVSCEHQFILCPCAFPCTMHSMSSCQYVSS